MAQKCLGVVGDHPRPIGDHFRTILTTKGLNNYIMHIYIEREREREIEAVYHYVGVTF